MTNKNVSQMTQQEKKRWLIEQLLKENSLYKEYQVPEDEQAQKDLLRALMNVRIAAPVSEEFLNIQDEYLQKENEDAGIVDSAKLQPTKLDERLILWQGDMTRLKVDAITNPANSGLEGCFRALHNCADNVIHSKAGIQLRLICHEYMTKQAQSHGGYYEEPTGRAVITPAYNLPSKYVIHTVGPIVRSVLTTELKELLASCYTSVLDKAEENGLESVALCCISTGVFMFPQDKAADIAVKTVCEWLKEHPESAVKRVIFNVYKDEDLRLYDNILNKQIQI